VTGLPSALVLGGRGRDCGLTAAQLWPRLSTLSAAEGCVRCVSGGGPETEQREVVATASEAGGDPSPIALDIDKFREVFIS
jgi:hypothetical protein